MNVNFPGVPSEEKRRPLWDRPRLLLMVRWLFRILRRGERRLFNILTSLALCSGGKPTGRSVWFNWRYWSSLTAWMEFNYLSCFVCPAFPNCPHGIKPYVLLPVCLYVYMGFNQGWALQLLLYNRSDAITTRCSQIMYTCTVHISSGTVCVQHKILVLI